MLGTLTRILTLKKKKKKIRYEIGSLSMIEKGFGYEMCNEIHVL